MPKPLLAQTNETPSSHGKTGCPAWIRTKTEASKGPSATITLPDKAAAHSSLPSDPAQRKTPPLDCRGRILTLPPDREPSSARSGPERNGARKQIQRYLRS